MRQHVQNDDVQEAGATAPVLAASLPEWLVGLVSEDVWAQSNARVAQVLRDRATRETRRRLYIEALAEHLLKEIQDAQDVDGVEGPIEGAHREAA